MTHNNVSFFQNAKRVVVKVGSGVLTLDHGLNLDIIKSITQQICKLMENGMEIFLVSSGAMASGVKRIGLLKRPDDIPQRQAAAAVGQSGLIMEYEKAFSMCNKKVAQILLTGEDLFNRERYLNIRNTFNTLLSWKVVPIINENDTVSVEEIKFGDNDNLAAIISILMNADILVNLTDIDGLFTKDPRTNSDAELIPLITRINEDTKKMAGDIPGALGTGGMLSKINAAVKVTSSGIPMVIANGKDSDILTRLFSGEQCGTFFVPTLREIDAKR
ncbi:MAG: glutamate 5-kinase [Deltaproteobacteria bacterium]|nr:glutamate 5-kinase [Deltaproteobacteria bacterium]